MQKGASFLLLDIFEKPNTSIQRTQGLCLQIGEDNESV